MNELMVVVTRIDTLLSNARYLQPGYQEVPVVEMTLQALAIVALIFLFIGVFVGVRITRPRYWD